MAVQALNVSRARMRTLVNRRGYVQGAAHAQTGITGGAYRLRVSTQSPSTGVGCECDRQQQ